MERRNSLTKEEQKPGYISGRIYVKLKFLVQNSRQKTLSKRNDARRQSMLAVTDIKKMQKMDSRKNSITDGKKSRRGEF